MGGAWSQADRSSRDPGHCQFPLPRPQFSHLKSGNMTCVTGLFEQLYKTWPDTTHGGEIQSTGKDILVSPLNTLDGWAWREVQAHTDSFNPGRKSSQGAAPGGLPCLPAGLSYSHLTLQMESMPCFFIFFWPFNLQKTRETLYLTVWNSQHQS